MKVGVLFRETFRGSFHLLDDPFTTRAADVHLIVNIDDWAALAKDGAARLEGTVSLEGIADRVELEGSVRYRLRREKRVPYDFTFVGEGGTGYRFRGQREPHPVSPLEVFTNLRFSLYDPDDHEIGRGLVRCDLRSDLRRLIGSVRAKLVS